MRKDKVKRFLTLLLIVAILSAMYKIVDPFYTYGFLTWPKSISSRSDIQNLTLQDREEVLHSFGEFSTLENYTLKLTKKAPKGENRLALYFTENNEQSLVIAILREHLSNDLGKIKVLDNTEVEQRGGMEAIGAGRVLLRYMYPYFHRREDLRWMGHEAIIKGISVNGRDQFRTQAAEVYYVRGKFIKIGLYKEEKEAWFYPVPVFDFGRLHDGAIAFIKSKKSGRVIIAVNAAADGNFNEAAFRHFLESFVPDKRSSEDTSL